MIYGLYQSAAGMLVNQYRQAVIANNLANVETPSFKRRIASFSERLIEAQSRIGAAQHRLLDNMTGGVWPTRTSADWRPGPIDVTDNPLDVAIIGEGFFGVQTPDGPGYTRIGRFAVDAQGRLVTATEGWVVLDEQGNEIILPLGSQNVSIGADGSVLADGKRVARLQVVVFDDLNSLGNLGKGLLTGRAQARPISAHLRVGALEGSNVEPMYEMAAMIEAYRAYELNAQMVSLQDATLGRLVNDLARPG